MMKRIYYKTNLSYLNTGFVSIIYLCYLTYLMYDDVTFVTLFLLSYVVLFFWCIIDTYKNRKALDEIIENGRCVNAKVKRLIKVSYEYNWGYRGGMDINCYQIEAEYLDHTYISDPVLKRYRNKIPKEVKIYSYMGRDCFVWEPHKGKRIDFEMVDGKDLKGDTNRSVLAMFTVIFTSVFCLTYIVLLLGWMGILT